MLEKSLVESLYPGGWEAEVDGDLDNFNQATADNVKLITDEMTQLAFIRCPHETPVLSDLEREYGIVPTENGTEAQRRENLKTEKYKQESDGSIDTITNEGLHREGFTELTTYENDPAVDPDSIIGTTDFMTCDSGNAYCDYQPLPGEEEAICGTKTGIGYVLANGRNLIVSPEILSVCDEVFCDDDLNNSCDYHTSTIQEEIIYPITDDPNRWAHFLFVGGSVIRGGSGEILQVSTVDIDLDLRDKLERVILKLKPIEKWVIMAINYI